MKKLAAMFIAGFACVVAWPGAAKAQRGGADWMTENGDAQRSAWVRTDAKINKDSLSKPGFQFLWKLKVKNESRQLNSLTPPATLDRLIGYRGFRMLGFFGGSADNIFTLDTDLGRMEWEKRFRSTAPAQAGTLTCPGGMTTGVARPTLAFIPPSPTGVGVGGGGGRSTPAKSGVGEPGQGAVTLALVRPNPPGPAPAQSPANPTRPNPANPPGGQFGRGPFLVYALSSDGMLHALHLSNGADYGSPVQFLPPNANASGLIVIENVAYVVTQGSCGSAANGVWALDLVTKQVSVWKGNVVGSTGVAFGADGAIYVATGNGGAAPNSLMALDAKTLTVKAAYSAGNTAFSSTPVLFDYKGQTLIVGATEDGRVHLLDSKNLGTALFTSPASGKDFEPGALASWQDTSGARWVLAPTVGPLPTGFAASNGAAPKGAVVAWKIVEQNGAPTLQPAWVSRDLVSPLTPTIINGVAFVTSSGEFRSSDSRLTATQRAQRSSPAVIYALDAQTGKELWSSGATITSFAHGGAIAGGMGQIYLTTSDGTIYAFGFPMEH